MEMVPVEVCVDHGVHSFLILSVQLAAFLQPYLRFLAKLLETLNGCRFAIDVR